YDGDVISRYGSRHRNDVHVLREGLRRSRQCFSSVEHSERNLEVRRAGRFGTSRAGTPARDSAASSRQCAREHSNLRERGTVIRLAKVLGEAWPTYAPARWRWLGGRESNPDSLVQSQLSYH